MHDGQRPTRTDGNGLRKQTGVEPHEQNVDVRDVKHQRRILSLVFSPGRQALRGFDSRHRRGHCWIH